MSEARSDAAVTVLTCIGCGALSTPQPCLGTCADRRLELVSAQEHEQALARLAGAREITRDLAAAGAADPEAAYRALQARARAAVTLPPLAQADAVTTWECVSCGRIEAPQECIGVCVRNPVPMIRLPAHAGVLAQLNALSGVLRLLAWSTPRPGQWGRSLAALRCQLVDP